MGEPTCLMRSFSHPTSASRESKEGDPFRALTESISFGRFMSESLAWEKWSTFSHNRYLEEVEQFSKPGSVAQKKAFFEAHYKKRAAMKAASSEQPNATFNSSSPEEEMVVCNVPDSETTVNNSIPEEVTAVSHVPETETTANSSITEEEMIVDDIPETENMDITCTDSLSVEATHDIIINKQEENQVLEPVHYSSYANNLNGEMVCLEDAMTEKVEGIVMKKEQVENPIQVEHLKPLDNVENYDKTAATPEEEMSNKEAAEKENVALHKNNVALPINKREAAEKENVTLHKNNVALPVNKRLMNSSLKSSSQNRASKIPKSPTKTLSSTQLNAATSLKLKSKSSAGDSITYKKLTSKSVHQSINFTCNRGSSRMSKDCPTPAIHSARASVCGISKRLPSVSYQSDDKRNRSLLNKLVAGGNTTGGILQALSGDRTKCNVSNARSPIRSSPFCFRSEERAAKRKEFFQKLEERNNLKTHPQVITKVALACPRSPKLGRKPSSCAAVERVSQLPRRPSVNAEISKRTIPKSNQSTTRSVTLLPRKKAHENASPNIQL